MKQRIEAFGQIAGLEDVTSNPTSEVKSAKEICEGNMVIDEEFDLQMF